MLQSEILSFFAQYIESELGIIYADHNYFQLQNRLEEITKLLGFKSIEELHTQAKVGIFGPLQQLLLDLATNNETSFFRDAKIFKAFEQTILTNPPIEPLRIWSAASSAGQEAISLAITINEYNDKNKKKINFSILGSDISERILTKARNGIYSQLEVQRGLPTQILLKYFKKDELDRWSVNSEISKFIQFKKQNLKSPFNFAEKFHVVLCRNVLIYQNIEGKIEILKRMTETLLPQGLLVLGSGESLLGLSTAFEQVNIDGVILYRKKL
jgi:chemotaxis protein methyltransferase CheR